MAEKELDDGKKGGPLPDEERASIDSGPSIEKGDILSQEHTDPVLNAKMRLVNDVSPVFRVPEFGLCCLLRIARQLTKSAGRHGN